MEAPTETQMNISKMIVITPTRKALWSLYETAKACLWLPQEVILTDDLSDWRTKLNVDEKNCLLLVLAFFTRGDGPVSENLVTNFLVEFADWPEAVCFYGLQFAIENFHTEMYQILFQLYTRDGDKLMADTFLQRLLELENSPAIEAKRVWTQKWLHNKDISRSHRLVAFACVEGIFFSASFCAIFWFKKRGLLHGLTQSNVYISRDEGLHWLFAAEMLKQLRIEHRPDEVIVTPTEIAEIIRSAVEVELMYVAGCLPVRMIGMNEELMSEYVRFVADMVAAELVIPLIYHCASPFEWMSMSVAEFKSNFFERQVAEYTFRTTYKPPLEEERETTTLVDSSTLFADYDY